MPPDINESLPPNLQANKDALEENAKSIRSLLGVTDNDEDRRERAAICNAQETGSSCARCERTIGPSEPVWRQITCLGRGFFGGWRHTVAPHCEACKSEYRDFFIAAACESCGRPVHDERNTYRTFCSEQCRHAGNLAAARDERRRARGATRACEPCGDQFEPTRSDSRFCSSACRQAAYRRRSADRVAVTANAPEPSRSLASPPQRQGAIVGQGLAGQA
jgi:endogenous inhibitor of DNA gyrase (YacG/DUF329 family)